MYIYNVCVCVHVCVCPVGMSGWYVVSYESLSLLPAGTWCFLAASG